MNVLGYTRVSTAEQAQEGVSLATQEEKIRAYCVARGWECVETVVDAGESGSTLERAGLQHIIELCQQRKVEGVVVLRLDRLTRSVKHLGFLLEDIFQKNGVEFTSVQDSFDTTTANGRLVLNVLGSVAQWEREMIAERITEALHHLKENGQRYGPIPFGFQLGADGKSLEVYPVEQKAIRKMERLREGGFSYRKIAEKMISAGVLTKNGGTWDRFRIHAILERQ